MNETTIFPREQRADFLFEKILNDPWACEKLQETFVNYLRYNDDSYETPLQADQFAQALFNAYRNRDLSAFLMAICNNTLFDLLRNSFLIPYRFNADGKTNPVIMTDDNRHLLSEYKTVIHDKEYQHFCKICQVLGNSNNIYLASAYRYSHCYAPDNMTVEQKILEQNNGVLLIRELPDTVKQKETEAEAYSAVWDLMIALEKALPMSYIFYGQDSLVKNNIRYDEIGIFLPNSIFLTNLEHHIKKAEEIIYAKEQ